MTVMDSGIIALWFGSLASIPAGFVLCDGNNGTPDLRDKFLVGAGDTFAVNDTGGNVLHNHDFTGDGHNHDIGGGPNIGPGVGFQANTSTEAVTGTTNNANGLPPYHSLAYIMKV